MEAIKCIKERRSIRKFKSELVDRNIVKEIVDVAAYAPSWKNSQIARYIVVENRDLIDKIAEECVMDFEYNKKTLKGAPSLVIVTAVIGKSGYETDGSFTTPKEDKWESFDSGIACQTFCLAAHDKGVGTVIMGIFDEYKVAEIIEIPQDQKIVAFIAMGYAAEEKANAPKRMSSEELLTIVE